MLSFRCSWKPRKCVEWMDAAKPCFPAIVPDFSAKHNIFRKLYKTRKRPISAEHNSAVAGVITMTTHVRATRFTLWLPRDCNVTYTDFPLIQHQFKEASFWSAAVHSPASLDQAVFKIAALGFNNSSCASLVIICACHSSFAMPARPEEESLLPPLYEHHHHHASLLKSSIKQVSVSGMSKKGYSVRMAIGCPSAPVKIHQVWSP